MKLIWKFNLVLLGIFLLGTGIAGYVSYGVVQANAREEIVQNARLMMEAALASRTYTNTQVKPLLETQLKYAFLPQTVPAYAATEVFNEMRKRHPDYGYKEATLNPTNPRDRASDWEADVVNVFRQAPTNKELIGERDTPTGRALYLARLFQHADHHGRDLWVRPATRDFLRAGAGLSLSRDKDGITMGGLSTVTKTW